MLDPEILTIGFARRFATYKRADLLLQDPDRLEALITSDDRPVQFIFAGKAHPKDNEGKELIRRIVQFCQRAPIRHRFVFLENYDMQYRPLSGQGADVWLNTPRRPFEACGTSGMKAAVNGVLNVSILDGWWCEGYREDRGLAHRTTEKSYDDHDYQDAVESQALYNVLENEVIPCFYDRKNGGTPARWVQMMKESIKMVLQDFCTHQMIGRYNENFYRPAVDQYHAILAHQAETARKLVDKHQRLKMLWDQIQAGPPVQQADGPFRIGDTLQLASEVSLGELLPHEVEVELYYGPLKAIDAISAAQIGKNDDA